MKPDTQTSAERQHVADLIDDALLAEFATELDEFGADAAGLHALLNDQHLVGFAHRAADGVEIEGLEGGQVASHAEGASWP